ncbi:DNA damage-inducible transcript 4 protein [Spea bombifrons]|uniref:DNA damage-inducible transcript 4 protein n=1 Tax=Spea bombifrons TaxID=233779 RepID=UPI00234A9985|nr:DNA damage-inducible transcript 4 protein [Spea bombifrons]
MPAPCYSFSAMSLPPPILEEPPAPPDFWDVECADLSQRCSSLPNSDCESLTSSNSFSECDFDGVDNDCTDNISLSDPDLLSDPEGEQLCPSLLKLIKRCLSKARISSLRCARLLPPDDLLDNLGHELLHLAYSEPCGLRGALIDLCVEHGKTCHSVAQITADQAVIPTFQLTVLLRLDSRLWPRIQGLFSTKPVPGSGQSLKLSPGFKVLKKKLYSSEELIIEEC